MKNAKDWNNKYKYAKNYVRSEKHVFKDPLQTIGMPME